MNANKPVAWMDDFGNVFEMQNKFFYIPLYTTPQIKELSDDEIIEIRQNTKASSTNNWADSLAFARAILKKAGEK
jgi:hypothetical protein